MNCINANYNSVNATTVTMLTGANKNNYTLTGAEATHNWTIKKLPTTLKIFVDDVEQNGLEGRAVYDGNQHTFVIKAQGVEADGWVVVADHSINNTSVYSDSVTYSSDYPWLTNYVPNDTFEFEWGITQRPITVTYTDEHKVVVFGREDLWDALGEEMAAHDWYLSAELVGEDNILTVVGLKLVNSKQEEVVGGPELGYGRYELVGVDLNNPNYAVTFELGDEAYLLVTKNVYDMSGITFANVNVVYDGQAHAAVIAGELPAGVEVSYENATLTNVGTINAIAHFTGDPDDYELIPDMQATITITKATYDMSGIAFANVNVVYDGQAHVALIAGKLPQGVTVTYEDNSLTNVGTATAVAHFAGDSANYNLIADKSATVTVTKAPLVITSDNKNAIYGDAAPAFTVAINGLVGQETSEVLGGALAFACEYAAGSNVGEYAIVPSGLTAANYDIAFVNGVLTVGKKAITVTAANKTSVYGKALQALTATVAPELVAGDKNADVFTLSTTATITSKPGAYPINVVLANNANYDVTIHAGTYTITEAAPEQRGEGEGAVNVHGKEVTPAEAANGVSVTELFDNANADNAVNVEVEIEAGEVSIVFDNDAISAIAGAQGEVTLQVTVGEEEGYEVVINVNLNGATFDQGKATVTMPYDEVIPEGKVPVVYYIDADGNRTAMKTWVENGEVKFEAPHFSKYALAIEDAPKAGLSGGAIAGIVIAVVVVLAGVAVAVVLVLKKKGGKKAEPKEA